MDGKCHPILFYYLKKLFYQLYHTILQYTQHSKTLLFYHFIKILFFNLFLLFLSNNHFFFKFNNYSNVQIFNTILLKYYFFNLSLSFLSNNHFFSNSTTIPTVTFSIEPLHLTNGHIFNIYRSTSYQQLYFQHI